MVEFRSEGLRVRSADATLEFASVPAKVALAEMYRSVEFPEAMLR